MGLRAVTFLPFCAYMGQALTLEGHLVNLSITKGL